MNKDVHELPVRADSDTNPNTRRTYRADVEDFMAFLGLEHPDEFRSVTQALGRRLAVRITCATKTPSRTTPFPA